eukprot:g3243.t1
MAASTSSSSENQPPLTSIGVEVREGERVNTSERDRFPDYNYPPQSFRYSMSGSVPPPCCYSRKVGRFYVCCERPGPPSWGGLPYLSCMVGPCWPMMLVTASLIIAACVGTVYMFVPSDEWALAIPVFCTMVLMLYFFFKTACSNPGIQPRWSIARDENWTYYAKADSFRPPGVVMCSESEVLIENIDHFCPWTGTTIARNNIDYFNYFNYSLVLGLFVLISVGAYGVTSTLNDANSNF